MNIGKAAKLSNLTVKTVRYYADIGLVSPVKNNNTGYRDFSEDDVARLQFVSKARKFNFSIQECEELLSLYSDKNRSSREVKALTLEKISQINVKLLELKDLKKQLSFLADNCKGNDRPDCPILDALSEC
ncbi:Cu(I)-responsive transcriptional regulator [Winogradskyella sp.]|uniref:Cu(I)-responsive transcriptional regulator n=1 Tax=Winogradskyella sp. TaxID=1883156 RepID=UPI003512CE76